MKNQKEFWDLKF